MNVLLVNPVHPSTPHISGVRAWRFARELAGMGHRVVLLTASGAGPDLAHPPVASDTHDWSEPLVLVPAAFSETPRPWRLGPARKVRTLWQMLNHGGGHAAWSNAAVTAVEQLQSVFRPDVIWATVGKMESAFVARRLSRALAVPWVLDLKDNWELFVPPPMRSAMARRVAGWTAVTANAGSTGGDATRWHRAKPHIIYSGVDDAFFGPACAGDFETDRFVINLIGSLYFSSRLQELLSGIDQWTHRLPQAERDHIEVRYIGGDTRMFEEAVRATKLAVRSSAGGYVPIDQMATDARAAAVNMYVAHSGSFHHKLLELLASGRPVMAFPGECDESRTLAAQVGGELIEACDRDGVERALDTIHQHWPPERRSDADWPDQSSARQYSWNTQARLLEKVLANASQE